MLTTPHAMNRIERGARVQWQWGRAGFASGVVEAVISQPVPVTREVHGSEVTRCARHGNRVLVIRRDDGSEDLKLESEIATASEPLTGDLGSAPGRSARL